MSSGKGATPPFPELRDHRQGQGARPESAARRGRRRDFAVRVRVHDVRPLPQPPDPGRTSVRFLRSTSGPIAPGTGWRIPFCTWSKKPLRGESAAKRCSPNSLRLCSSTPCGATWPACPSSKPDGSRARAIRSSGKCLGLLHSRIAHPWTIADLADEVGISRSALVERFTRYLSEPPMTYFTRWRLQLAARSLERTSRGVADIAADVGYESEAAFNRAFKREFGQPPGRYRSEQRNSRTRKAAETLELQRKARPLGTPPWQPAVVVRTVGNLKVTDRSRRVGFSSRGRSSLMIALRRCQIGADNDARKQVHSGSRHAINQEATASANPAGVPACRRRFILRGRQNAYGLRLARAIDPVKREWVYSYLNATIGSTRVALRAGIHAAPRATPASVNAKAMYVPVSIALSP